jgi:hypothetical protein
MSQKATRPYTVSSNLADCFFSKTTGVFNLVLGRPPRRHATLRDMGTVPARLEQPPSTTRGYSLLCIEVTTGR